jgi:pimeloyl-ACP methyl ester carboxylesterase
MKKRHIHWSDLHGYSRLAIDATLGITDLVEAMHLNFLHLPAPFGKSRAAFSQRSHGPVRKVVHKTTGLLYGSIRRATHLLAGGLDLALGRLQPELEHLHSTKERDALISILNGVLGDHMTRRNNPLTITMGWRLHGKNLALSKESLGNALPHAHGRILVMLHGHCMNETQWTTSSGHNHGEALAAALGFTPMVLRYNSGLHISQNGRALADQLAQLVKAWPVSVEELCIVGYSMGGLLARSAFHYGEQAGHGWMPTVRKLIFVGTPHHGSMLEQAGNLVDIALEISPYSEALARLGKIRSAGTTDLRHGNLLDVDWMGRDRFARSADPRQPVPLPEGVQCYAIAAMISKEHNNLSAKLVGDGLVPLKSALGQHHERKRALHFPHGHQKVFYGTTHLGLLDSQEVCSQMRQWIDAPVQ